MTDPSGPPAPGLRERKRRATRLAIQRAALDLATRHGVDGVTVEAISAAADISPRTFFNYFPSKEQALLGDFPELSSLEAAQGFLDAGSEEDILTGLGRLFAGAWNAIGEDLATSQRRRLLLRAHPVLLARRMAYLHRFEDELTEVVSRRLAADDPALADDPVPRAERARLIALIGFATLRYAYGVWIETEGGTPLVSHIVDAFAKLNETLASTKGP